MLLLGISLNLNSIALKTLFLSICMIVFASSLSAQSVEQKVVALVCNCLGKSIEVSAIEKEASKCMDKALLTVLEEGNEEEKEQLSTFGGVQRTISKVKEQLSVSCPMVQEFELSKKKKAHYSPSSSAVAREHYFAGKALMEKGLYKKAAKELKKAIKSDERFVLAIDDLAITYKEINDFEYAILYFQKSLAVFPEGDVALKELASMYYDKNELEKAQHYFDKLKSFYPGSADGYLGAAKIALQKEIYECALKNVLVAHKILVDAGSLDMKDSEAMIHVLYRKYSEQNKNAAFLAEAEKQGIELALGGR